MPQTLRIDLDRSSPVPLYHQVATAIDAAIEDGRMQPGEFLALAHSNFALVAGRWLSGTEPFKAKLNPAYAPYDEYDQLMRLEEWYGR